MGWISTLRNNPLLFGVNARLRAARTEMRYRSLMREFAPAGDPGEESAAAMVRARLAARHRVSVPKRKGTLRIFFVGTDYSQDSSGILQALARYGDIVRFEARPGTYGALWPKHRLLSVRDENSRRLLDSVGRAMAGGPVDVVLGQMWGFTIDVGALRQVAAMGPVVVNISMDDRHAYRVKKSGGRWVGTSGLIPALDLAATAAPECRAWYVAEGCPAVYLPEASDPDLFRPLPGPREHDVCFVGANYGIRREIVGGLERAGIRVAAYGNGWPNGPIATERVPELFARSRIVLGVGTVGYSKTLLALKMRDFDGPMSGSLYLTHHNPDLESLYDVGREIVTYRTIDECVRAARFHLDNPGIADEIARAGRARALRDHTWETRFGSLFRVAGILEGGTAA